MTTFNHTGLTEEQIKTLPYLGRTVSNWRGRTVALYQHPETDKVISWGRTFNGEMEVICTESKADWTVALDYAAQGKVYVSD